MAEFQKLQERLEEIDRRLGAHRGNTTPEHAELLRLRRETVMQMADLRRQVWGD